MGMKMMTVLSLVCLGALFLTNSAALSWTFTCQQSITNMLACQDYLRGAGPATPGYPCCKATSDIMLGMDTPQKRRALCQCLKGTRMFRKVNAGRVSALPDLCRFGDSFPLGPNCNSV